MKQCFCGCGRDIPCFPLGIRSINTRGRLVAERLDWGAAHAEVLRGIVGVEDVNGWLDHGSVCRAMLQTIVHRDVADELEGNDELERWPLALAMRETDAVDLAQEQTGDWLKSGRELEAIAIGIGLQPLNRWLKQRPSTPIEELEPQPDDDEAIAAHRGGPDRSALEPERDDMPRSDPAWSFDVYRDGRLVCGGTFHSPTGEINKRGIREMAAEDDGGAPNDYEVFVSRVPELDP